MSSGEIWRWKLSPPKGGLPYGRAKPWRVKLTSLCPTAKVCH